MEGWIKIHRQIQKNWIWNNAEYLKAWIAILITVNHEDNKVLIHGELFNCGRGESLMSLSSWTKTFGKGWSIRKTRTFFTLLENDAMICTKGMRKTTCLTVCNYDSYQDLQQTNNKQTTDKQQANNKQITTNKNEKNDKNEKNYKEEDIIISDEIKKLKEDFERFNNWLDTETTFIRKIKTQMTEEQFIKLKKKYNSAQIKDTVLNLENYKDAPKRYTSVYLTVKNWLDKDNNRLNK